MNNALYEKLDVWGFEEGLFIYKDLSLGAILKIEPRDISCATDDTLNSIHQLTSDFLNSLPPGLNIQFVQSVDKTPNVIFENLSSATQISDPLVSMLSSSRAEILRDLNDNGLVPCQNLFVVVRKKFSKVPDQKKSKWWKFNVSENSDFEYDRNILNSEIRRFLQVMEVITSGLEAIGINATKLDELQSFNLLFDQWNPNFSLSSSLFNHEDIRNELLLSDLVVSLDGFSLGRVFHKVVSLKLMPELTFASMSERLRDLPFNSKLYLSIECLNQDKETAILQTHRRIAYAMYAGKKGVSDLESEAKLRDLESLLAKRVIGEEKIFSVSLSVLLRNENEEVLNESVGQVLQTIRELSGAEGMVESLAAAPMFFEFALPNGRARERSRRMNTSVLSDFLPIFGDWNGHENQRLILRNRRGSIIGFDPFSSKLTNFNQIISGGSGAGKSFLTNLLIAQLLRLSPKVFILDIGGSYQKLTENLDGQYIPLGSDSNLSINPFDVDINNPEALDQKIKFIVSLVELMTKESDTSGIGKLERSEIEQNVKDLYKEVPHPRLSNLRLRLLKNTEPALQRMGKILGPWCGDSPYGKFIDRQTNLLLNDETVCFDLKGLESQPDLQAVCLFLITDLIWREVQKDRTIAKIVVFDECWKLLENEGGSRFIGEVFRTFRKYRASAIAISQTMDDFAKSKVSSAILPNSSVKWILKQTGGNIPTLKEVLLLNDREIKLIESVTSKKGYYSEAFLVAGDDRQVVVVESTPLEYWLATSDPLDIKSFQDARTQFPEKSNFEILSLLSEKFPRGASVV